MKKVNIEIINEILVNGLSDLASLGFNTSKNISKLFIDQPIGNDSMTVYYTKKESAKLPTIEYENYISCNLNLMNAFVKIKTTISSLKGIIIYENTAKNNEFILGKIGSGFMNLNPAVICIDFSNLESESKIHIATYAKEGLVKQNTSQKAFELIKKRVDSF